MSRSSARRELAFVLGVALAGLVLVGVVAFVPWYSPGRDGPAEVPRPEKRLIQVIEGPAGSAALTPVMP